MHESFYHVFEPREALARAVIDAFFDPADANAAVRSLILILPHMARAVSPPSPARPTRPAGQRSPVQVCAPEKVSRVVGDLVGGGGAAAAFQEMPEPVSSSPDYDVKIQFMSVAGDPVSVLIKVAAAHHADGIVLGASQAIGYKLFGAAAVRTVRRCRCPVIVVP